MKRHPAAISKTDSKVFAQLFAARSRRPRSITAALLATALLTLLSACSHHHRTPQTATAPTLQSEPQPTGTVSRADQSFAEHHEPLETLRGLASWYGPQYNHHRAANGQVYDQNAVTAAHRTLPLNTLVRVTNEKTGQSALMYITDRGPFVPGRILDLSRAAAKQTGVYLAGVAPVRIDVLRSPESLTEGGHWAVQIGAFAHTGKALRLKRKLLHRYPDAQVIDFAGPTGHWVRIRPADQQRATAESILRHTHPAEGTAYLVRLN